MIHHDPSAEKFAGLHLQIQQDYICGMLPVTAGCGRYIVYKTKVYMAFCSKSMQGEF